MFSFHKPKIYRSNLGCCICKAKSSSSRFTDSKKYENEFEHCFRIEEKRSGEICNACVLLVKRWKKLSPENRLTKHWHHVVDARAGPGTKLTSGRRFNGPSTTSDSSSYQNKSRNKQSNRSDRGDVLPLSSSQANNQSTGNNDGPGATSSSVTASGSSSSGNHAKRNAGLSSKGRANDTNSCTFTIGESTRRSYMTAEPMSSASSLHKPQSALNSSAFESVIKRFRQRQQQQQLEAQRRLMNKKQRSALQPVERPPLGLTAAARKQLPAQVMDEPKKDARITNNSESGIDNSVHAAIKRVKRSSESIGSLCVDGLRVSTLLDGAIWRKEKICCGTIFRGRYNEVAIFPKLLKPCSHRLDKRKQQQQQQPMATDTISGANITSCAAPVSPPPPSRTTKSGSISSCDSATSGTGSMEMAPDASADSKQQEAAVASKSLSKVAAQVKRPSSARASRRQQKASGGGSGDVKRTIDTDSTASSSSSSAFSSSSCNQTAGNQEVYSPSSSSAETSSSRLLLMGDEACGFGGGDEELDDAIEEDDAMALDEEEDEDVESGTDASSSIESLAGEVDRKKSGVVGAMG